MKYFYYGQLVDIKIWCIGINDKKLGITNDIKIREKELDRTKSAKVSYQLRGYEIPPEKLYKFIFEYVGEHRAKKC